MFKWEIWYLSNNKHQVIIIKRGWIMAANRITAGGISLREMVWEYDMDK